MSRPTPKPTLPKKAKGKKEDEYLIIKHLLPEPNRIEKTSMRNTDICDELILSKEGMRFDQMERDQQREQESKDALMLEAEAALAQTESVLKTRKDALRTKHIEGRESLHELDYIFSDPDFKNENYLDEHRKDLL